MDNPLLDGFTLDGILVEPLTGQYASPTRSGHLPPRAVEVLLYLAKHPRRLVTRAEILTNVWGDGQGSAEALSHVISDLRHAFDDHASDPRFFQTVPRRGYRLLVEPLAFNTPAPTVTDAKEQLPARGFWSELVRHGVVQASAAYLVFGWLLIQVGDATFQNLGLPSWSIKFVTFVVVSGFPVVVVLSWFLESAEGRMVRDHGQQAGGWLKGLERNYLAIVAAYALAVFGVGLYQLTVGFAPPEEVQVAANDDASATGFVPVDPASIAVLQFASIDGSERSRIFSKGISEDILDRLAMVAPLSVASRSDSWSIPKDASSADIRRRLRVAYFVEGSVRLIGDELRVVAQLIDSATGRHVISRSFDDELDDYLSVQKNVTQLIVANLRVALPQGESNAPVLGIDDAEIDTYLLYQRGREALRQPATEATLAEAEAMFARALQRDPGFAAAHAGICEARLQRYEQQHRAADIEAAESACSAARRASARLPQVYVATGRLRTATGEFAAAREAFETALELDEQNVYALEGMAQLYKYQQQYADAKTMLQRAVKLQPGNWELINEVAALEFVRGRYDEAANQWAHAVFLNPRNYVLRSNLGSAQIFSGEFEAARATVIASLDLEATQQAYSNLGVIEYMLGNYDAAIEAHRKALAIAPRSHVTWANFADSLYFNDKSEAAREAYGEAAALAKDALAVNPSDVEALYILAWAQAMQGDASDALMNTGRAVQHAPEDPYVHYFDGLIKARLGDSDRAAEAIATAAELGYPVKLLVVEPHLQSLRTNAQFASLIGEESG